MTYSDCANLQVGNTISSGLAELGTHFSLALEAPGPWRKRGHLQLVREQVSKGMAPISALDIFGESLLGVFSKRTQTPSGP